MSWKSSSDRKQPELGGLDSVLYEFERALLRGDYDANAGNTINFDDWIHRVDSEIRPLLSQRLIQRFEQWRKCVAETTGLGSTDLSMDLSVDEDDNSLLPLPRTVTEMTWRAIVNCPSLRRLPRETKAALAVKIRARDYTAGTKLLCQGKAASGLFLIAEGQVEILDSAADARTQIDIDGPGSVLGEMSLLTGQPCTADVIATTDVLALVLSVEDFEQLREQYPELEIALSQIVSDRLGQCSHDALCGKSLGGYRLLRCISRGAMGVVYEAICEADSGRVALKMLRHRFLSDNRAQSRFDLEADILRTLQHPHIVGLLGHFVAYRTRFLVLELCTGADLKQVLRRHGRLDEATIRSIMGQIAEGLSYAHGHGILHLDLKPANVLVHPDGRIAITDFGLGRLIESDGCDQCVAGTPPYMPPEQFKDEEVGPGCDAYALGCLACELLTGTILFRNSDIFELYEQKRQSPQKVLPAVDISDALKQVLLGLLEPSLKDRRFDFAALATWARPVAGLI